jgi:hypothetical protein
MVLSNMPPPRLAIGTRPSAEAMDAVLYSSPVDGSGPDVETRRRLSAR